MSCYTVTRDQSTGHESRLLKFKRLLNNKKRGIRNMIKRDSILIMFAITFVLLVIINIYCTKAEGTNWETYYETQNFYFYYNADTKKDPIKNILDIFRKKIVKAWTKRLIKGNEGRNWQIQENKRLGLSTKGYENYEYTISLKEINCSDKMVRTISDVDYSKEGNLLAKSESPYADWKPIIPESDDEALHKAVCTISITETPETDKK